MSNDDEDNKNRIPDGRYLAVVVPQEVEVDGGGVASTMLQFGWTGAAGAQNRKPQVVAYCQIIEGPETGWRGPWFGFMGKDSYERTMQSLRYAGMIGNDVTKPGPMNRVIEIEVANETYEGKTRSKIQWINDPNGVRGLKLKNPMSAQELKEFVARMAGHFKKLPELKDGLVNRDELRSRAPVEGAAPSNGNGQAAPPAQEQSGGMPWDAGSAAGDAAGGYGGPDDDIPF